jgi:hypothetical protein
MRSRRDASALCYQLDAWRHAMARRAHNTGSRQGRQQTSTLGYHNTTPNMYSGTSGESILDFPLLHISGMFCEVFVRLSGYPGIQWIVPFTTTPGQQASANFRTTVVV